MRQPQAQEQVLATIALLLGPDTAYSKRLRASQQLAQMGPEILPLLLQTLQTYPEISTPTWPWWPPQYEHLSRLLILLSQSAGLTLEDLLHYPGLAQPAGTVLWTSVTEAAGLLPHMDYEPLLRESLLAPWWIVRYAAAIAIANRAAQLPLCMETRQALYQCQSADLEFPVRLVAACALLRSADNSGLETLLHFLRPEVATEIRKAALFILATELPASLAATQKADLSVLLLQSLQDSDSQVALHAARTLKNVASPTLLPDLQRLLEHPYPHTRLATLIALEELSGQKNIRKTIQQQLIPQCVGSLLLVEEPEIRRQACYTLAALGGEYTIAFLGTMLLDTSHPAHLESIEALRLLPDAQQLPILHQVIRWLLHVLTQSSETAQICALDSLSYLLWQARTGRRHRAIETIRQELARDEVISQLLMSTQPWIRQRTVELLVLLDLQAENQRGALLHMLHHDVDSNVRGCIASMLGRSAALWAIPDLLQALLDDDDEVTLAVLHALNTLALLDDGLILYAVKEVAAYRLPLQSLHQGRHLAHTARVWLKTRKKAAS
jgi:HEAT repeat protein